MLTLHEQMTMIEDTIFDSSIPNEKRCEAFWSKAKQLRPDFDEIDQVDPESLDFHQTVFDYLEERKLSKVPITQDLIVDIIID